MTEKSTAPEQPPPVDSLIKWLVGELSQILDLSSEGVDENKPFSYLGLDSAKAIGLMHRFGEFAGKNLPIALAWQYPNIRALAAYVGGDTKHGFGGPTIHLGPTTWNQPIAIIGMSCRFPKAPDPEAFWDLLREGRSAFREISSDRWNIDSWYDPDPDKPGKMNARMAGLLDRLDEFDPGFFGVSPREAILMDPQQRLVLELAWEALENAGLQPDALRGSSTGLFVGTVWHDYEMIARKAETEITSHTGTGQASSIVANRISYALGFQGPSIALDTACSSSLVSVHLACRSLQAGDTSLALAGGVSMIIDPETMVSLSKFGGLSPTGQLRAFDGGANGFVRGEGAGFVVLKALDRALADGDPIYAVIRGTAVNNDGASNGLTAPNPQAQEAVLQNACTRAGISPADVHYVEAHGTGTPLGDPIEAHALGRVFNLDRPADRSLLIGSVKTNIGHLEGASGIAGLIKLVLSIHKKQIPPSLNFEIANPHIDFAASNLRVVTKLEPWPEPGKPALGGASAFGWGGTNCHVVVQGFDHSNTYLLPLSASDPGTLEETAEKIRTYLDSTGSGIALRDICATAAARFTGESERVALTAGSVTELSEQLQGFLLGQKRPGVSVGQAKSTQPKLAFVFSPQGSQWHGMGRSLIAAEPVFRAKLAECDRALTKVAGWSLFDQLLVGPDASQLNRTEFVQPALSAMQIALTELLRSWGVHPDIIAAHSLGEWAAACAGGVLTVEETMRVVVESSRAQAEASADGGMAIAELGAGEIEEKIRAWPGEIFVAGFNSPKSTILSGDAALLKHIVTSWKKEGIRCALIDVDVPAHCPRMDVGLDGLKTSLSGLRPVRGTVPFVSSVNGDYILGTEMGPEHWAKHLREPVHFTQVIERLARDGYTLFLEIGPNPVLGGAIRQTLSELGIEGTALGSCRRGDDERGSLLNALGALYTIGWPVEWAAVTENGNKNLSLPIAAPKHQLQEPNLSVQIPLLFPLSAHTAEALKDRARSIAVRLKTERGPAVNDIAYTLASRRSHLGHRLALVGSSSERLVSALDEFVDDQPPLEIVTGAKHSNTELRVAFVCSGQGTQWWGMGRELLASIPLFRREMARCADEMRRHVGWDLLEELARDEANSRLSETEIAQPALFALQLALAALWRSWGIEPRALVGHSVGEVATAYLGGILSFDDAVKVICHRGRLMQRATGLGRMAAIELPEAEVDKFLEPHRDLVSLAAVNSPTSIVISGAAAAIDEIVATAKGAGLRSKVLPVNYAFHSPQMEPFINEMEQAVAGLKRLPTAAIQVFSTVTGAQAAKEDFLAGYWGRNIRQTVRFAAAIRAMLDVGVNAFVELGPHPVLASMVAQCAVAPAQNVEVLPSLRRGQPERIEMFKSLANLFVSGAEIDWQAVYPCGGRVVSLPPYPWQRKRYWLDQRAPLKPATSSEVPASWFYEIGWEEKPRADDLPVRMVARRLPSPGALGSGVKERLGGIEAETRLVHSAEAREDIEKLAAHFAATALFQMGLARIQAFTATSLHEQLGVQRRHGRLLARMLEMLVEEGLLKQSGEQFETAEAFQSLSSTLERPSDRAASLSDKHPDFATEFELLARCGGQLPGVLRGEVNPLELLFPTDGSVSAERLYRDSPSTRFYNRLMGELIGNAAREGSRGSTVRLLEIGAGTGSTTNCVLEQLSGVRTAYCFTDISRLLVKEAGTRFARFSSIRYATLNIEKPLEEQEFEIGGYDIVLAANVLHATVDLRATLKQVRQLLAPGGLLVLGETTAPRRWLDLIFGLTEGWGRFSDTDLRPKNGLLRTDQWLALFGETGFREANAIGAEFSANDLHEQVVLVAKAEVSQSEAPVPRVKEPAPAAGRWLLFTDTSGLAEKVAQQLQQGGGECLLVQPGHQFGQPTPGLARIRLDQPEDYRRLIQEGNSWRGVLHAWTLDAGFDETDALDDLKRAEQSSSRSALFLVQALSQQDNPPKLWLLTSGAQMAWPEVSVNSMAQSPVWGLGRTVALEHPEFWGGLIDVPPDGDSPLLAERIALEMCLPDGEDQIALSEEIRLVPRLLSIPPPPHLPTCVKQDGGYLVTGGLGGLGPQIAEWLVESGARHLILCGRRGLPERSIWQGLAPSHESYEQVTAIRALENRGVTVQIEKVDVTDRRQMEGLFERLSRSPVPLRGIIHAAADIKFCSLREMSKEDLHATLRAKVEGSWLLHELSRGSPLDFFVLFSSTATLFGAGRLGHYAAANQFLDFLAHWRRATGLPALSVNWGAWEKMRVLEDNRVEVARFGLKKMPTDLALRAMSDLINDEVAQRMVADVNWDVLKPAVETRGRRQLFEHISAKSAPGPKPDGMTPGWSERLERIPPEERRELVSRLITGEIRTVLGLTSEEHVDPERGLFELGMDSLMSVQLKGRLEKSIGCPLPGTLTFTYPTVLALTDFLLSKVLKVSIPGAEEVDTPRESKGVQPPDENLAELSDDEIKSMLSEELSSLTRDLLD